jgi:hypothetical protein
MHFPRHAAAFACLITALMSGCGPEPSAVCGDHQAYVWQRLWTPAVDSSVVRSTSFLSGLRILAGQMDSRGHFAAAAPNLPLIAARTNACRAVFRVDGQIPAPCWDSLSVRIGETVSQWTLAGVKLRGVEIDYDCPSAKLAGYASALRSIRQAIDDTLALSITVLPCWIGARGLGGLLALPNETVLQVHSVLGPRQGIFDARMALRSVVDYARCCPRPFRVALPAYGSRVQFDERGQALAVENEAPRSIDTRATARELRVDPRVLSEFIHRVNRKHLPGLKGYVWFRLPTQGDARAWSLETLRAVVENKKLYSRFELVRKEDHGTVDLALVNSGTIDGPLSGVEVSAAGIDIAEPLSSFTIERQAGSVRFVADPGISLHPSQTIPVGWIRSHTIKEIRLHASR